MNSTGINKTYPIRRYASLDIIRGLAAFSVLLTHWGQSVITYADHFSTKFIHGFTAALNLVWAGGGIHPGVVVFIVLSGFCIHLPQANNPEKFDQSGFWRVFAIRRAVRIMPVFWVALALGIASALLTWNGNFHDNHIFFLRIVFPVLGIAEIARFFFDGGNTLYPGNGPLGTVGVEILLYASYPLFVLIHKRYGLATLIGFGLMCYLSIVFARFIGINPLLLHGTYFEFVLYWIAGAIFASSHLYISCANIRIIQTIFVILVVSYFVLIHCVKIKGLHVIATVLLALTTGSGLVVMLYIEQTGHFLSKKVGAFLAKIGERSYSLYAIHTPIISIGIWLFGVSKLPPTAFASLILVLVILATEIMYRLIERPCHSYARSLQR